MRVLVADDDDLVIEVLQVFLTDCGFEVDCARTGTDAVELGRRAHPDALICDFAMSDLDGAEVARQLQRDTPDLPVFVTSGHTPGLVRDAASGVRHLEVLRKPLDLGALEQALRCRLHSARLP
ncbi:MAG: response regulator [Myxococcales bacterium]|nr:response regulator [Myxococcales bacterium]